MPLRHNRKQGGRYNGRLSIPSPKNPLGSVQATKYNQIQPHMRIALTGTGIQSVTYTMAQLVTDFASAFDRILMLRSFRVRFDPIGTTTAMGALSAQIFIWNTNTGTALPGSPVVPLSLVEATTLSATLPPSFTGWLSANSSASVLAIKFYATNVVTLYYNIDANLYLARDSQ
jgi:hypothetical protein